MGLQAAPELLGIHTNSLASFQWTLTRRPFPGRRRRRVSQPMRRSLTSVCRFVYQKGIAYGYQIGLRPQTLYGIADSPVGLAAYFLDHDARSYELISRVFAGESEGLTRDDILDNITIAWLTNTALSGARLYWEKWGKLGYFSAKGAKGVSIPAAVSVFPDELYPAPRSWAGAGVIPNLSITTGLRRRTLCGLGTAETLFRRGSRGLPDRCATPRRQR